MATILIINSHLHADKHGFIIEMKKIKNQIIVSRAELNNMSSELAKQYQQENKISLEGRPAKTLVACFDSFSAILDMLSQARMGIGAIRKLLGIKVQNLDNSNAQEGARGHDPESKPEPDTETDPNPEQSEYCDKNDGDTTTNTTSEQPSSTDSKDSHDSSSVGSADSDQAEKESDDESRSKHGPRHANKFPNAQTLDCQVPGLEKGDQCPAEDCKGRLYPHQRSDSPRQLIVFDGQSPIATKVYNLNDLQCNLCDAIYKAEIPEEMKNKGVDRGKNRVYTPSCLAFLLVAHYYFGRSFRSLEQLTGMIGDRIADSTLNGKALEQRGILARLRSALLAVAKRCPVFYGDDIGSKVISILPEIRKSRSGDYRYRSGIYTSIIIAITNDGKPIPIFTTGLHHLGESFDNILNSRPQGLPPPIIVRDQSSSNKITACETVSAGCLQHVREYFLKAQKNYPTECGEILERLVRIFEIDRKTQELSPIDRLTELRRTSLPIMHEVLAMVSDLIDAKEATPSSDMGVALAYFKKHYQTLMVPYEIPGVGLTNNLSEWMTYPVVRYLNNSRHYATEDGAEVGDNVISLTMLALLSKRNPIRYIEYLLHGQNQIFSEHSSESILPWNIPVEQVPELEGDWFTNWIPRPEHGDDPTNSNSIVV